ncbi:corrinoid protein [Halarsenatibacter silvermanii]|uniref:Methylmalonyl-CoA mutase C-terminal domain-containing protein/methyltransferase cognate corrinoid proteins n=1 Tax=Halarsenatibacter silvermanii TaxID=321763 RepID=A0A1G9I4T7_9FIRM|nr:corrinoid protein [Halarsenatibacter silvermanii]SDL20239.1 methylmalonyl-CoA mutase C-terminal domain-containing protein/methyltransferase cognate corrinoid proteins [Halarsenatibacter silvermanii]
MPDYEKMREKVIDGDQEAVKELTQEAIDEDTEPQEIISEGLISGMNVVGERFKAGDMFVPEVLMSAKAMKAGMELVNPLLTAADREESVTVVLATVEGDLHDIGKNLVGMMLESGGMEVIDLGVDLPADEIVDAVRENNADVLGMSALLTTTMMEMQNVIEVLEEEGLKDDVEVLVGGAPVTKEFADDIGADGWAPDAASAKDLVQEMTS